MLVEHLQAVLGGKAHDVALQVHKDRFNGRSRTVKDGPGKDAGRVAIHLDGCDGRLWHGLHILVLTLTLVDAHIVVLPKMGIGKGHDVLLRELGYTFHTTHLISPVLVVDEGIHKHAGPGLILFQRMLLLQLHFRLDSLHQILVKITLAQFVCLRHHHTAQLLQCLAGQGHGKEYIQRIVAQVHYHRMALHHLARKVEVEVKEAGLTVAHDLGKECQRIVLETGRPFEAPCQGDVFGILREHLLLHHSLQLGLGVELGHFQLCVGLHVAKILGDDVHHLVGVKVATQADGHIVGYIVLVEEGLDVLDAGILQMVAVANDRVIIGMGGRESLRDGRKNPVPVFIKIHIVFLIHTLQLRMEPSQHHVLETVALHAGPVFHLIGRNVLHIHRLVVAGIGIGAVAADVRHHLVIFVGDEIGACKIADAVNLLVDGRTRCIVLSDTIGLIEIAYLIQQDFFLLVVGGAQVGTALKHHVFQIVGQTCRLRGLMLASRVYGNECLYSRLFLVHGHVHLQPVGKGIHLGFQRIALHGLVRILVLRTSRHTHNGKSHTCQCPNQCFHPVYLVCCCFYFPAFCLFLRPQRAAGAIYINYGSGQAPASVSNSS